MDKIMVANISLHMPLRMNFSHPGALGRVRGSASSIGTGHRSRGGLLKPSGTIPQVGSDFQRRRNITHASVNAPS